MSAAACGGSDEEACIILANGNKLCGADANAYCERFVPASTDMQSAAACASVGAGRDRDTTTVPRDNNVQAFADACVDYGGDSDSYQMAAEEAASAGIKYMTLPIRQCLEHGGDPMDCVIDAE